MSSITDEETVHHTDTVSHDDLALRGRVVCQLRLHDYTLLDGGESYIGVLGQHVVEREPMVGCRRCGYRREGLPRFWLDQSGPYLRLSQHTILGPRWTCFFLSMVLIIVLEVVNYGGPVVVEFFYALVEILSIVAASLL